jgi:hypothetical protein
MSEKGKEGLLSFLSTVLQQVQFLKIKIIFFMTVSKPLNILVQVKVKVRLMETISNSNDPTSGLAN